MGWRSTAHQLRQEEGSVAVVTFDEPKYNIL